METQEQGLYGTNAKETNNTNSSKNELTVKNSRIENTPFILRWEKEKGYSWGMAGYKVSQWYENENECLKDVKKITWDKIIAIASIISESIIKLKEIENKSNSKEND